MPWEVDYALLSFTQFKKSKYYLNLEEDEILFDLELNMSKHIFDWRKSKIPAQFFRDKFNQIVKLLDDYEVEAKIFIFNLFRYSYN